MAEIQPFRGVRYRVPESELARVLAPPYDVIPPDYQRALHARDPRNIVRVELSLEAGEAAYSSAAESFERWLAEGVLVPDPEPSLYLLEQSFELDGARLTRIGLLARLRVEDYASGRILPHEQTRAAAKEDRYKLLEATRANFSPIFFVFPDAAGGFAAAASAVTTAPPLSGYTDDGGVGHRLWHVNAPERIAAFAGALARPKAYIADGHHRYATALRCRDELGGAAGFTLAYFTPMESPGLVVLPYHRILSEGPSLAECRERLGAEFLVNEAADARGAAQAAAHSTMPYAFALAEPGGGALVVEALPGAEDRLPAETPECLRALDTYFLHHAVLGPRLGVSDAAVSYVHSLPEALGALERRACRLALLLRPTSVGQIVDVAEAGESMPAKSTYFHPKLPSGLVIHRLED